MSTGAPLRVVYVLMSLARGGAERSLVELLKRLVPEGVEPVVVGLQGGELRQDFEALGARVYELGVGAGLTEARALALLPILLRHRPAVVHARLVLPNLWSRVLVGRQAVVINEERGLAHDRPPWLTKVNRLTFPLCDAMVVNSQAVARAVASRDGLPPSRVRVVYGGVDVERFQPRAQSLPSGGPGAAPPRIVCVARLEPYKGVADLLEALPHVQSALAEHGAGPRAELVFVGGGRLRDALVARAAELGVAHDVTFAGDVADVRPFLEGARLLALPSHEEGLPNAVLEGMALGLPVVATAVGGTVELVDDGVTGALVPPRAPAAFAEALVPYLRDASRAREHGAAGRRRAVERFSVEATARAYLALYRGLLAARRGAGPRSA